MVVIGDISVGKTNIIKRLMGEEFIPCQATIGVDFTYVENQVKDDEDPKKNNKISLQIWDTCNYIIIYNIYLYLINSRSRKIQSNNNISFEKR